MSSMQSIFIIIIIIALAIVALMIYFNRKQLHQLSNFEKQINSLSDLQIKNDIIKLEKMDLAGESLATFEKWKKVYKSITDQIPKLQNQLIKATDDNTRYSVFKAKKEIAVINTKIIQVIKDLSDTKQVINELLTSNKDNQVEYDALNTRYRKIRKEILANSFEYGEAIDKIENILSEMEDNFQASKNLAAQGDYVESKRTLSKIKTILKELSDKLPKIRTEHRELKQVYPDQLSELSSTYKQMLKDKYAIKEIDVFEEIKNINEEIDKSLIALNNLNTSTVEQKNQKISKQIDDLYDVLTKEFKARKFVEKNQKKVSEVLDRLIKSSHQIVEKLEHIDQSYQLNHGELEESEKLESEVAIMRKNYDEDIKAMDIGQGVYSEIKDQWLRALARLNDIEARQKQLSDSVDGLYEAEDIANESLSHFKQEVALIYRRLQRRHLPGNSESFVQMYTLVVNEIRHASDELSQVRINMEKISEEMIQISDDVARLKKEADQIINSANLMELTMQYSNKFTNDEQIQRARRSAMDLYNKAYNYKDALDTIAAAVERAEPGSYQRLEKSYYAEKNHQETEDQG